MDSVNTDITKYPKSKNNFQCLGPCYQPHTWIVHPILLDIVTNELYPFCPVNEWVYNDPETGRLEERMTDICYKPTTGEVPTKEIELNMLLPYIEFNSEQFLKIYYNIFSFEDGIDWLEKKKYTPINTRVRVLNSMIKVFGSKVDIIDQRLVNFIIDVIKAKYTRRLYRILHEYIGIKNNDIILVDPSDNTLKQDDDIVARTNYIMTTFVDIDSIFKFLSRYFRQRKESLATLDNPMLAILKDYMEYIINKIELTLKK